MKVEFVWPSDFDRAESDELNRVCEFAEELYGELDRLRDHADQLAELGAQQTQKTIKAEQERDQLKARLGHCQRFLASGILYTYDELLRHDAEVIQRAGSVCFDPHTKAGKSAIRLLRDYANQLRQQAKCE
jgi:hypothetical protein